MLNYSEHFLIAALNTIEYFLPQLNNNLPDVTKPLVATGLSNLILHQNFNGGFGYTQQAIFAGSWYLFAQKIMGMEVQFVNDHFSSNAIYRQLFVTGGASLALSYLVDLITSNANLF